MKSSGGITDQHIRVSGFRSGNCIIDHGSRIGSLFLGDQLHTCAVCPLGKLVDGCGAEGISCGEDNLLSLGLQLVCKLSDGCGLSDAIDTDDENDRLPVFELIRILTQIHLAADAGDQGFTALLRILDMLLFHSLL